ncbi:hypothetical protein A2U01_0108530, partial [Trifolium medium]|nr:hypothetical protein [Trifolium medium]
VARRRSWLSPDEGGDWVASCRQLMADFLLLGR